MGRGNAASRRRTRDRELVELLGPELPDGSRSKGRLRWKVGELLAQAELAEQERLEVAIRVPSSSPLAGTGRYAAEIVGLGVVLKVEFLQKLNKYLSVSPDFRQNHDQGVVWVNLSNTSRNGGQFEVTGTEVANALNSIKERFGVGRLDEIVDYCVLWHSHYRFETPSKTDIREFPSWLVKLGIVYHTPSQTARAYNEDGEISRPTVFENQPPRDKE